MQIIVPRKLIKEKYTIVFSIKLERDVESRIAEVLRRNVLEIRAFQHFG